MIDRSRQYLLWVALLFIAGLPRVLAAFILPNEEGDPYAYAQAIDMMRASLLGGTFTIAELFGFWLPLYQFICALITSVIGHPLYVAKVFSAICGTGVCLLVFQLSSALTASRRVALLAFALIALNPIHVMYSAFSMSDVPHALMVMSSLYFAIKNRWVLASAFVAVGDVISIHWSWACDRLTAESTAGLIAWTERELRVVRRCAVSVGQERAGVDDLMEARVCELGVAGEELVQ
jgi:4-amino-4-deoxy-L-arabinose transferase-like glycosyltransferase